MKYIIWLFIIMTSGLNASIAKITMVNGNVEIHRNNMILKGDVGLLIKSKDIIITKKASTLQLMLNKTTLVTIGENTTFDFNQYLLKRNMEIKKLTSPNKNILRTIAQTVNKLNPDKVTLDTPNASVGIRGFID